MNYSLFAMDTFFYGYLGVYPQKTRCEMLKDIGYDGTYITTFGEYEIQRLEEDIATIQSYELDLAGVYAFLDIKDDVDSTQEVIDIISKLPEGTTLELAIRDIVKDNPDHEMRDINEEELGRGLEMQTLIPALTKISKAAEEHNTVVAIYPHVNFHVAHIRQAFHLCETIGSAYLKLMLTGFHDFATCHTGLKERIEEASPYLHQVNMSGVGLSGPLYGHSIDSLDVGVMDNFAVISLLKQNNFTGKIGLQGYAMGGDVYHKLEKNYQVFKAMEARLNANTHWGELEYGQRYWLPG